MSLASGDLTTLYNVKQYTPNIPADPIIQATIPRISRVILGALNRPLLVPHQYSEQYNGTGTQMLQLANWPLISLTSLVVDGTIIPVSPQLTNSSSLTYGYRFQPWNGFPPGDPAMLELIGARFWRGNQNIVASYLAGYMVVGEAATIPNSSPYNITPVAPYGLWATDQGVTFANGTALTAIASPNVPGASQYVAPDPSLSAPRISYQFSASDAGKSILLSYGFVPFDVEQVAIELIAERLTYRSRIGIRTQSLASQETIGYDNSGLTTFIQRELETYRSVIPPAIGASV